MAAGLGLLLGGAAAWDLVRRDAAKRAAASAPAAQRGATVPLTEATLVESPRDAVAHDSVARDHGQLWQSPTAGAPIDLRGVPSGSQLILAWRPAAMLASDEGARLWKSLGPWSASWDQAVLERTGLAPAELASLVVACGEDLTGGLSVTLIVEVAHGVNLDSLRAGWGAPPPLAGHDTAWADANYGYYLPVSSDPRRFVVAPRERLADLLEQGDEPPPLSRELEQLAETSDRDRWLTLLLAGGFLSRSGRAALIGELPLAGAELEALLGEDTKAAACSLHVDERLFCELRTIGRSATRPRTMSEALRTRITALPTTIGPRARAVPTTPAGSELLARLPEMLQLAADYTRVDVEGEQVVARTYLPAGAAHHLALAGQILLVDGAPGGAEPPASIVETRPLERRVTLRAPRTTLEAALAELSEQIRLPIALAGGALQREGITRNQMFAVDLADVPAAEALEQVLRLANSDGKLIYTVIGEGPQARIEVTTRAAAGESREAAP